MTRPHVGLADLVALGIIVACGCGAPTRTEFVRYPGAPSERDPAQSDPKALAIADRVFIAAGGNEHWALARELRWTQTVAVAGAPPPPPPPPTSVPPPTPTATSQARRLYALTLQQLHAAPPAAQDHLWDRWNGRYALREQRGSLVTATIFDIYGDGVKTLAVQRDRGVEVPVPLRLVSEGDGGARATWHGNTALLCLPFLLREPGVRLHYPGPIYGEDGEFEEIRVTFDPADPRRSGSALELIVNKAGVIERVSVEALATHQWVEFDLHDWMTVTGLSFSTTRVDRSTGDVTHITNLAISSKVNDDDFQWSTDQ